MPQVDALILAAKIIRGDGLPDATAIAVAGGRVVWVGDRRDAAALACAKAARHDFGNATVTPGLIDAHLHTVNFGRSLAQVDLRPAVAPDIGTIVHLVAARAATMPRQAWVLGRGYDQNRLAQQRHPTRADLDRAAPDHPVMITHNSGHMSVANSAALALAGVTRHTPAPAGGAVEKDAAGEPTGLLLETAQDLVRRHIPPATAAAVREAIALAHGHFAKEGLTAVHEAGCPVAHPHEPALYQAAVEAGELKARTHLMIYPRSLGDELHLGLGLRTGIGAGGGMLSIGPLKLMADGSLIGRTAVLDAPYEGAGPEGTPAGIWVTEPARLRQLAADGKRLGWQLATHAIGDRAIRVTLDAYAEAVEATHGPRLGPPDRVEHCGVLTPDLIRRLAATGVVAVTQPRFIYELGDGFRAALGEERLALTYPLRSLLAAGVAVAAGSDRPVVDGAPLLGIEAAVNQRTASGAAYVPDEAVTFRQALAMYTSGAAYAAGQANWLGRLRPGMAADLTVIGGDPEREPAAIGSCPVVGTMVNGRWTYLAG